MDLKKFFSEVGLTDLGLTGLFLSTVIKGVYSGGADRAFLVQEPWEALMVYPRDIGFVQDPCEHSKLTPTFKETSLPRFIQDFGLGWVQCRPRGIIPKPGGSMGPACPDRGFVAMLELRGQPRTPFHCW